MFDFAFTTLYDSESVASSVGSAEFMMCTLVSIVCGVVVALIYMFRHSYNKNFVVTLALLPVIVQMVITLVNGNLGAGIAVMGVFNLVRFRTVPGSAKDIASVFFAMAVGLATGMGFVFLAVVITVVVGIVNIIFVVSPLGKEKTTEKYLKISVPEDLEFEGVFDNVLSKYTDSYTCEEVRTTNMGSLFKLTYKIQLKNGASTKEMMDELRTLNGNLGITVGMVPTNANVL